MLVKQFWCYVTNTYSCSNNRCVFLQSMDWSHKWNFLLDCNRIWSVDSMDTHDSWFHRGDSTTDSQYFHYISSSCWKYFVFIAFNVCKFCAWANKSENLFPRRSIALIYNWHRLIFCIFTPDIKSTFHTYKFHISYARVSKLRVSARICDANVSKVCQKFHIYERRIHR